MYVRWQPEENKTTRKKKRSQPMDRQMCLDDPSLFREKDIFVTMAMPSGYMRDTPIRFQDGSIVTCASDTDKMRRMLETTEWDIDSVTKMMLQTSTLLDAVNGDSRLKLFRSPQQGLILEMYRDRMMALGWSYPPITRFDIRNRSCWATEFELQPTMVTSNDIGYWVWFFRSIHDPAFEKHKMDPEKLRRCIEDGRELENGAAMEWYGQTVTKETLLGHPSHRRRMQLSCEVLFFWKMKLFLRETAYRFYRIYGNVDEVARVDNNFVLAHLHPSVPASVQTIASEVDVSPNCDSICEFMRHLRRDLPAVPGALGNVRGLSTLLKPFQVDTVNWMLEREDEPYELFVQMDEDLYYSPIINWWRRRPFSMAGGGFLCTEFGMGKTIMCFGLFLQRRGSTLVITTTTLLSQWKKELENKTNLSVGVYHGAKKQDVDLEVDVVLTTYGVMRSRTSNTPLLEKDWHRLVVDESHNIKNHTSVTATFLYALKARNKWLVTATPIQTRMQDFYGQLKMFNQTEWTNGMFQSLFRSREVFQKGNRLSYLLKRMCHAYTRVQKYGNGDPIIQLPPIHVHETLLALDPTVAYESLRPTLTSQMSMGELMGHVEQLRRYCSNGSLKHQPPIRRPSSSSSSVVSSIAEVVEDRQCPICLCAPESPVITRCGHILCMECSLQLFRHGSSRVTRCPLCRSRIEQSQTLRLVEEAPEVEEEKAEEEPPSVKLLAVFDCIRTIRSERPNAKIVVFSQYLQTLNQLMKRCPHPTCHIQGSTAEKKRALELQRFVDEQDTILFLSMRSGACGINLNNATDVVLVEPAVNEALEDQAVGRVHRIGQVSDVHVHRLILRDTIEERIMRIRRREGFVGNVKQDCRLSRHVMMHLLQD